MQLVKLLELQEANHIEFCRIKNVLDEILQMCRTSELNEILKLLIDPTWVAAGLEIDFETLVSPELGCLFLSLFISIQQPSLFPLGCVGSLSISIERISHTF